MPKRFLYEVFARDLTTDRLVMQPHEVIAESHLAAILAASKFYKMFTDIKSVRFDVNKLAELNE